METNKTDKKELIKKESIKSEKDPLLLEDVTDTGDMLLIMENSPVYRDTILGFAARFFMDNEHIIKQNMEKLKKGKESEEPQESPESKVSRKGKKRE